MNSFKYFYHNTLLEQDALTPPPIMPDPNLAKGIPVEDLGELPPLSAETDSAATSATSATSGETPEISEKDYSDKIMKIRDELVETFNKEQSNVTLVNYDDKEAKSIGFKIEVNDPLLKPLSKELWDNKVFVNNLESYIISQNAVIEVKEKAGKDNMIEKYGVIKLKTDSLNK